MREEQFTCQAGEGVFRTKENGRLEYRIPYYNEFGERCRKSVSGGSEEECLQKAETFLIRQEKRNRGIEADATIPDILKAKYETDYLKNLMGEQGLCRNLSTLNVIERSFLGTIPIADLTERHIDFFLQTLTGYSNSGIRKLYHMLRSAFELAMHKRIIEEDIMRSGGIRCPRSKKRDKKVRGLTEEEQERFIQTLLAYPVPRNRNDYRLQLLIELYGGMRMGEINALRPEDIDFDKRVIHVHSTVSRGLDYRVFVKEGTKTEAGMRDVPINKMLENVLRQALACMKRNPDGLVFYDFHKNCPIDTQQVNCFFDRVCKKCGIPNMGQHSLRHTYATRCIEAGVEAIVLKTWLGHTDIHITLDTYTDVFNRMDTKAVEKYEAYMSPANSVQSVDDWLCKRDEMRG